MTRCYKCGETIFFDDEFESPSGKKIPLDEDSSGRYTPHDCPEKSQSRRMTLEERVLALENRVLRLEG